MQSSGNNRLSDSVFKLNNPSELTRQEFFSESYCWTDLRTMSSVQPPLRRAIWSSWHMLTKGVIFMAIRMMRLIARSISVTRLIRLLGSANVDWKEGCGSWLTV